MNYIARNTDYASMIPAIWNSFSAILTIFLHYFDSFLGLEIQALVITTTKIIKDGS